MATNATAENRARIISEINSAIFPNTQKLITAKQVREMLYVFNCSKFNLAEDSIDDIKINGGINTFKNGVSINSILTSLIPNNFAAFSVDITVTSRTGGSVVNGISSTTNNPGTTATQFGTINNTNDNRIRINYSNFLGLQAGQIVVEYFALINGVLTQRNIGTITNNLGELVFPTQQLFSLSNQSNFSDFARIIFRYPQEIQYVANL